MNVRISRLALVAIAFVAFAGAASAQFTSTKFDPVVQGQAIGDAIDLAKLEKAILVSLNQYNWAIVEKGDGFILAKYEKDGGKINAVIKVTYDETGYAISYVDSKNLDVDLKKHLIHKNYVRWIANLNKTIYNNYLVL